MLIPIRTDNRLAHRPYVNYAIVGINAALFLLGFKGDSAIIEPYLLDPMAPQLSQFFSSMFLHASVSHIIGNMLFLWVFGNAVNDRFGHVGYSAFYLAGGVLSGVGYVLLGGNAPVLGASGAIAGVTGCYLVLFPRVRVTLLAFLVVMVIPLEISSLYFLGFQVLFNLYATLTGAGGGVAYAAHIAGYAYGIAIAVVLLAAGVLPRDVFDMISLIRAHRRRASYQRMTSQGYNPFGHGQSVEAPPGSDRWAPAATVESASRTDTPSAEVLQLRQEITQAHGRRDFAAAAEKYLHLVSLADDVVLPRQQQLDVANQLMGENRYAQAADAYERLLAHYPKYEHIEDIQLMLGIIYGRYLGQQDRAAAYLRSAIAGLHDSQKLTMARAELDSLGRA